MTNNFLLTSDLLLVLMWWCLEGKIWKTLNDKYYVIFEVLSAVSLRFSLLEYDALWTHTNLQTLRRKVLLLSLTFLEEGLRTFLRNICKFVPDYAMF